MHQQPRGSRRVPSPAASPQNNSSRPNNPRESPQSIGCQRAAPTLSGRELVSSPLDDLPLRTHNIPSESVKKLDQIVQNFFNKVATVVIDSRVKVKHIRSPNGQAKVSKWFQLNTIEFEDFRDDLKIWKTCGSLESFPQPMVVEIYLDTSCLKESQSLTIIDDDGKRWDVMEQLNASVSPTGSSSSGTSGRCSEVILERWRVNLKMNAFPPTDDFGPNLPTIYKKAIVFFRSLCTATKLLPAWKFASQSAARNPHPALTPRCRIRTTEPRRQGPDLLRYPIDGRLDSVTDYMFGDVDVPVGRFNISVTYRNDCSFRIDDAESLLSSRFMGVDEDFFKPSLPKRERVSQEAPEVGSHRDPRPQAANPHQTYGSLSTFHGDGPVGTSPISALRAVKPPGSDYTNSPPTSFPTLADIPPNSLPVSGRAHISRPVFRGEEESRRRPSISFQPFKAGSLSGSPVPQQATSESSASPHSLNRPPSLTQPRTRTSLTAGMPASLRGGPPAQTSTAEPVVSSSPRPSTSRYSSSFTHRRGRSSISNVNRVADDDQVSSGRQSLASSIIQPGSGLLAEADASSGSLQAEEDNISEFLKALDSKKTLRSFESAKRGESVTNKTVAQLSKFHMMRESNNALGDSMTSSMHMQGSLGSSSRQPSVPGASMSASSSPIKPHSPHTPYTPTIPSRLSTNSIADDSVAQERVSSRNRQLLKSTVPEASRESTIRQEGTTAIDIPLSPRLELYQRRSSSVAQQNRTVIDDNDADLPFAANRSLSLGADDREPPTMSGLLGLQIEQNAISSLEPVANSQAAETSSALQHGSSEENPPEELMTAAMPSSPYGRRRYKGMGSQHRHTPPQSSRGSYTGSSSRLVRDDNESLSGEPLMFDLSEMDAQGRRSLEEGRGGGQVGSEGSSQGYRGVSRRGW